MRILDFTDGFTSSAEPSLVQFASEDVVVAAGSLTSTNVQAALEELQAEIIAIEDSVGTANGIVPLGADSKISSTYLPPIAITSIDVVANIAARDALSVEEGDVAKVTDSGDGKARSYMWDGTQWIEFAIDSTSASDVDVTPSGNLSSTNAQAALQELQGDIDTHLDDTSAHGTTGDVVGTTDTQTLSNKTVGIANGLVGTPSLNFTSDTDTGIYRVGADTMGLTAGGILGLEIKKSTGAFSNVGVGVTASVSDQVPLTIERSNASAGTYAAVSNTSTSANAFGGFRSIGDNGAIVGTLSSYTAASTLDAYISAVVLRASGSATKLSLAGPMIKFYTNNDTLQAAEEALRLNADFSMQFMQQIATPTTPAANSIKLYQKSDDSLYVLNDAGTEAQVRTGTVAVATGGTGQTTYTDGQLLIGNTTGNTLTKATLTAGAGVTITNGSGSIQIASSGSAPTLNYTAQSSTFTAAVSDYVSASGASFTITLPTAVGNSGKSITIEHAGTSLTQVYTIQTTSSQTIGGIAGGSYALYTAGETLQVTSNGANWRISGRNTSTAWTDSGVITIGATTTPPTKGTTTTDRLLWRREGNTAILRYEYRQTTAGAAGSGTYLISIPANMTINTTVMFASTNITVAAADYALASVGPGAGMVSNATASGHINSKAYNDTQLVFQVLDYFTTANNWTSSTYQLSTVNIGLSLTVKLPISGWQP